MINTAVVATTCIFKISSPRAITIRGAMLSSALFIMALLGAPSRALAATAGSFPSPEATRAGKGAAKETLLKLPLRFEDAAEGQGMAVHLAGDQLRLGKAGTLESRSATGGVLSIILEGANQDAIPVGEARLPGRSNYFFGSDASKWRKGVEQFSKARVRDVYHGIDLLYYGNGSELEHDYLLAAGSDPYQIHMQIHGGTSRIDHRTGDLVVTGDIAKPDNTKQELVRLIRPVAYQSQADGSRRPVGVRYAENEDGTVGFTLDEYDHARPLTIDPVVTYSTYFGGSNGDEVNDIRTDAAGNLVLLVATSSTDLPVLSQIPNACVGTCGPTNPSPQGGAPRTYDFYLAKLDPTGQTLLYSTYIGGTGDDYPGSLVVAPDGTLYIAGTSDSLDFPVVNGYPSVIPDYRYYNSATLTKLSADGSTILYSSLIGAGLVDSFENSGYSSAPGSLALGTNGIAYLIGSACCGQASFLDAKNATFTAGGGSFVAKFDTTKSGNDSLLYATTFGQPGDTGGENLQAIAIDSKQDLWVVGYAYASYASKPIPTSDAVQPICDGGGQCGNAFIHGLTPAGAIFYTSFLGGTKNSGGGPGFETPADIVIDSSDNIYLSGTTESVDFPLKNAAFTSLDPETTSNFLTKLSPGAKSILYSTYTPSMYFLATLPEGVIAAVGNGTVPQVNAIPPNAAQLYPDVAFEVFDTTKSGMDSLLISSYLGSLAAPVPQAVSVDAQGNLLIAGVIGVNNLLLVDPYKSSCDTCGYPNFAVDGFVTRVQLTSGSLTLTSATQSFPDTPSGASSLIKTSTLNNTTSAAITLSAGTLSDATDFTASDNCNGAIASGASCTITFTFTPQSKGTLSSTYSISDVNNPSSPLSVVLSGTRLVLVPAATLTPVSYNFGNVTVGSQARKLFTFTNTGSTIIQLTGLPVSGNGFNYAYTDGSCGKLNPGESCLLDVSFTPTSDGASNGSVQIQTASGITYKSTLAGTGVGSATLNPATYNFQNVTVGETVETVFTFTNTFFSSVTTGSLGTSGSGFAVENGTTCGGTLNPGASCTIHVSFTPASDGAADGSVHLQAGGFTYTSTLTGTGVGSATLNPASHNFGNVNVGASAQTAFTWTNTGPNPTTPGVPTTSGAAFNIPYPSNCGSPVNPGASCTIQVLFTPTSDGAATGSVQLQNNGITYKSTLTGTGVGSATLNPASHNFGNVTVGASAQTAFTWTNTGPNPTTPGVPTTSGAAFNIPYPSNCGSPVNPGASCTIQVLFTPTSDGAATGSVQLQNNGITYKSTLTGTGVGSATLNPASHNFGNVTVGASAQTAFTWTNTGPNPTTPGVPTTTGTAFSVPYPSNCASPVNPGASCTIQVLFTPTSDGAATGSVQLQNNGITYKSTLTGTGVGSATLNPASHNFGNVTVGASAQTAFTWTNTGSNPTTPGVPTTTGTAFSVPYPSNCASPVNPGASCSIQVLFTPTSDGAATGSVQLQNNGITYKSTLTGTGVGSATLNPASHNFGNVTVGASAQTAFTWTNTGSNPTTPGVPTTTGTAFSVPYPSNCASPVNPGASCSIQVLFTPTSDGAATGSVQIKNNGITYTSTLTGTGVGSATLNPASHNFGNVNVGASSGTEFTFTNTRSQYAYAVGPLSVSGSAFQLATGSGCDATDGILLPGQSCTIYVLFSPTSGGTATGSVQLQLNRINYVSTLTGTGVGIATTTSLVANPNTNLVSGRPITLTATVTAASGTEIPTGTITFEVAEGVGVTVALDKTGKAVYTGVVPPPGTYSLFARYSGAAGFGTSSSATIVATVSAP